MKMKLSSVLGLGVWAVAGLWTLPVAHAVESRFIQVAAKDKFERSAIANHGMSIESVYSDSVWGFANTEEIAALQRDGFKVIGNFEVAVARGGHEGSFGFPDRDDAFHDLDETIAVLRQVEKDFPQLAKVQSIGKSIEGRDIWAIHFNSNPQALATGQSNKPGAIFLAAHHAREHVSTEMALYLVQYLVSHQKDPAIQHLLETRDLWFVPVVNPDGKQYDIASGSYRMWRKNRRRNADGTTGVDLNRNYGFEWGTGGSSHSGSSDVYMGEQPFSEPETQAVRDFVNAHLNAKILLSFHTFSELILYPWGHTHDEVTNGPDLATFKQMGDVMARWNHYTPQSASDLYIASGDTVDWAYGTHGIFAFTFELSPRDSWGGGGFYPGAGILDQVFEANLRPALYLMDLADNPHRAKTEKVELYWDRLN